jgi:hypothetical protein
MRDRGNVARGYDVPYVKPCLNAGIALVRASAERVEKERRGMNGCGGRGGTYRFYLSIEFDIFVEYLCLQGREVGVGFVWVVKLCVRVFSGW